MNGQPVNYSRVNSAIKVPVNALSDEQFIIETTYDGTPQPLLNPLGGSGMSQDDSPTWGNDVVWSLSEPFSAYEWFPCKQSLTDKADSSYFYIIVPSNLKAGSNGVLTQVTDLGNGFKVDTNGKTGHPIDYYLISVSVASYVEYNIYANPTGAPNPILIQNYIYDNPQTLPYFQDDIDETVDFMELFYELFGPYPFEDEKYAAIVWRPFQVEWSIKR